jgi:hypothetical protein
VTGSKPFLSQWRWCQVSPRSDRLWEAAFLDALPPSRFADRDWTRRRNDRRKTHKTGIGEDLLIRHGVAPSVEKRSDTSTSEVLLGRMRLIASRMRLGRRNRNARFPSDSVAKASILPLKDETSGSRRSMQTHLLKESAPKRTALSGSCW